MQTNPKWRERPYRPHIHINAILLLTNCRIPSKGHEPGLFSSSSRVPDPSTGDCSASSPNPHQGSVDENALRQGCIKKEKTTKKYHLQKKKKNQLKTLQNQNGPTFYPPVTGPVNTWQFSANSHDCCSSEWPPPLLSPYTHTHTHIKSLDDRLITADSWSHCCFSGLLTALGHPAVSEHWALASGAVWISSTPA